MKKYAPTTPSRRHMTTVTYRGVLTASEPHKPLTVGGKRHVGRNNAGRITVRHKGGGHKRLYRAVDFVFDKKDIPAKVETVEYDPNRSGFIGLVCYRDGERRYVLLPKNVKPGDEILTSDKAEIKAGNRLPLKTLPLVLLFTILKLNRVVGLAWFVQLVHFLRCLVMMLVIPPSKCLRLRCVKSMKMLGRQLELFLTKRVSW